VAILSLHCNAVATAFTGGSYDAVAVTQPALLPAIHYYTTVASLLWLVLLLEVLLSLMMLIDHDIIITVFSLLYFVNELNANKQQKVR